MVGGLYDPLGTGLPAPPRWRPSVPLAIAGTVLVAMAIFGILVALRGGGERGEPRAVVTIDRSPPVPPVATPSAPVAAAPSQAPPVQAIPPAAAASNPANPGSGRETDIEVQNGVRIVRMRSPESSRPSGQVLTVPSTAAPLPKVSSGVPPSGTP